MPRWRRLGGKGAGDAPALGAEGAVVDGTIPAAELRELEGLYAPPGWLRNLGRTAWLLVGVFALIAGLVWFLGATYTIGGPFVAGMIIATVAMPVVGRLARHMPRAAAAAVVLVGLLAIAVLVVVLVIGGITSQNGPISQHAASAVSKAQDWLQDVGVNNSGSSGAASAVKTDVPQIISSLTKGVISGIRGIASVIFGLSLAMLSTFFLLKDGPSMRSWVDRHMGVPPGVGRTITGGVITSLRGYFRGVTLVAAFNGIVVGIGSLILDVPLAGTIAVVTFVTAYVPYIGAFVAGAFAVLIALGAKGATTAAIMLVIVILANGLLQNIVQPIAMGATLRMNPLLILVVTISAGAFFGTAGLILAAPLTSAALHISGDLAKVRATAPAPTPAPAPPPT
jgi:predicted PurR-regulated permease PerM